MKTLKPYILLVSFLIILKTTTARDNQDTLLTAKEKSIISIASLTAKGDLVRLFNEIDNGLQAGLTVNQIKEVQVHLYAYCGFPRSIRGLQTLMQVIEERRAKGLVEVPGSNASSIQNSGSKYERGRNTLSKLTNSIQEKPTSGYGAFAPIIDTFLKEHLFADIFDRDVLTYAERELVTIAVLSTMGNVEPMLRSHYTICLNLGITANKLYEFTEIIKVLHGNDLYMSSQNALDEVLKKKTNTSFNVDISSIFPLGAKVTGSNFKGTVYLKNLIDADTNNPTAVGSVTFEPGARTNWHQHPGGQILLVIDGIGYYQEKGQVKKVVRKGEVVKCQPNIPHWHGASADATFVQVAITNRHLGETIWMHEVTDEEYNKWE